MSRGIQFIPVTLRIHGSTIIDLNVEYLNWAVKEIDDYCHVDLSDAMGISIREYVTSNIESLCSVVPPQGIFYLLELEGAAIGMGGLRRVRDKTGEIKRMYIRPGYRGNGYGKALLNKLIQNAKDFGYHVIFLDTGPFMTAAQRLYRSAGFSEREEYPETEVPLQIRSQWLYMEKIL